MSSKQQSPRQSQNSSPLPSQAATRSLKMSSKQQSTQQSQNSSTLPPQSSTRSLIASKVSFNEDTERLLRDLAHNYLGVEKVSQLHDKDGQSIGAVRIDFKSDNFTTQILDNGYILIDGKRRPVRPYWPLICHRCQNEGHRSSECPQKPLTEQRLIEIFKEQQMQLQGMINGFENKWNARLSSFTTPSTNVNADQLLPIFKDLTTTCQQFNQQTAQMQRQLGSVVSRVQDVQMKLNNEQARPQLPIQNGH